MWFRGNKSGVQVFFVCWGAKGGPYNIEAYQTLNGLAKWMMNETYREVPVHHIGRLVFTDKAAVVKETWETREEFLEWARPLVGFEIPKSFPVDERP